MGSQATITIVVIVIHAPHSFDRVRFGVLRAWSTPRRFTGIITVATNTLLGLQITNCVVGIGTAICPRHCSQTVQMIIAKIQRLIATRALVYNARDIAHIIIHIL